VDEHQTAWIAEGTKIREAYFERFTYDSEEFTFYFDPYQVAAYTYGFFEVKIPYFDLRDMVKPGGPVSLIRKK
jgi:hypothetical protein